MAKAIDWSKDGAEPLPWVDYAPHLILLCAAVGLVGLRAVGVIGWSWWAVLTPFCLLALLFIASYMAAVIHRTNNR